ncbi:MAG: hypothetical protein V4692_03975 [Bdellovibrionota bacterium]
MLKIHHAVILALIGSHMTVAASISFGTERQRRSMDKQVVAKAEPEQLGEKALRMGCYEETVQSQINKIKTPEDRTALYNRAKTDKTASLAKLVQCFDIVKYEEQLSGINVVEYKAQIRSTLATLGSYSNADMPAVFDETFKTLSRHIDSDSAIKSNPSLFSRYSEVLKDFYGTTATTARQREFLREIARRLSEKGETLPAQSQQQISAGQSKTAQ